MTEAPQDNQDTLPAFKLPAEIELSGKTRIPPEKLGRYLALSEATLKHEVQIVTNILKRFAKAVADASTQPENAESFLLELDLRTISKDHKWRDIFTELKDNTLDEKYTQTALIRYLQFLSFRKRLLEFVHARKAGLEETTAFSQTAIFDANDDPTDMQEGSKWVRLPMGEAIRFKITPELAIDIRLAQYKAHLVFDKDAPRLVDETGGAHLIGPGRNIVGRHPSSDIVIATGSAQLSRAHCILEQEKPDRLMIMDLSSGGTFITRHCMNETVMSLI